MDSIFGQEYLCSFNILKDLNYLLIQVEFAIKGNDMFIGTVLKALELEDLVSHGETSHPCYLARSFIRSTDAPFSLANGSGDDTFESSDFALGEGDDKFYEASETLNDESPRVTSSDNLALKALSFRRVPDLLPTDKIHFGIDNTEVSDTLDSFVKAQIVIYDQNSVRYDNVDTKVNSFTAFDSSLSLFISSSSFPSGWPSPL